MSQKASLYVVERKEVIILVVLFVLVTVLSFTMGVKYGVKIGKKEVTDKEMMHAELTDAEIQTSGHLSDKHDNAGHDTAASKKTEMKSNEDMPIDKAHAKVQLHKPSKDEQLEKETDAYLLEALEKAGIESKSKSAAEKTVEVTEKLPDAVKSKSQKKIRHYVIQVGSFPSRKDAKQQLMRLQKKKLSPHILEPFENEQEKWYRVALGEYKQRSQAVKDAKNYKRKGLIKNYFVRKLN